MISYYLVFSLWMFSQMSLMILMLITDIELANLQMNFY